jgi:outer membrane protein assembly factor BamB
MLLALLLTAAAQDGPLASPEPGWPQWRGKRRDGVSDETGLLRAWPEGGPKLLWKSAGLGRGWSSPIVVGDRIFITGDADSELVVRALDLGGREVWRRANGKAWKGDYPGARATCTYSESRLYHLNAQGRLACLDAASGEERWAVVIPDRFSAQVHTWAYSEAVVVDGPRVLVTAGGAKGHVVALEKSTGATAWATEAQPGDSASYVSPLLVKHEGRRLLLGASVLSGFGVDVDAGRLLWTVPMKTPYGVTASTPAYAGGRVHFAAAFINTSCWQLTEGGARVEKAWDTPFDTCSGSFVHVDGVLYAGGYQKVRGWAAVDWRTGAKRAELADLKTGASIWADGRLYALAEDGRMALLSSAAEGFAIAGQFRLTPARVNDCWAHPVLLDGRLYLRYHDELRAYAVKAP